MDWFDEPPTEPGYYWFYGVTWRADFLEDRPHLAFSYVRRLPNSLLYVVDGEFRNPYDQYFSGYWQRIPDPELPVW